MKKRRFLCTPADLESGENMFNAMYPDIHKRKQRVKELVNIFLYRLQDRGIELDESTLDALSVVSQTLTWRDAHMFAHHVIFQLVEAHESGKAILDYGKLEHYRWHIQTCIEK